jgi:hypothetical protein
VSSSGGCKQDKGAALCRSRADGMAGDGGRIEALRLWAGRRGEGGDLELLSCTETRPSFSRGHFRTLLCLDIVSGRSCASRAGAYINRPFLAAWGKNDAHFPSAGVLPKFIY